MEQLEFSPLSLYSLSQMGKILISGKRKDQERQVGMANENVRNKNCERPLGRGSEVVRVSRYFPKKRNLSWLGEKVGEARTTRKDFALTFAGHQLSFVVGGGEELEERPV